MKLRWPDNLMNRWRLANPRSLTVKLAFVMVGIALVSVALVAVFANYTINNRFNDYMREEPPSFIVNPDGTLTKVQSDTNMQTSSGMSQIMRHIMGGPEERFLGAVNESLWWSAAVVIIIACLTGIIFARRLMSPVRHMSQAAKEIAAGKLDHRINVATKDELGELAGTFNGMAATLDKNQQLNRQLFAGVAHELKTPLTIIQGNLEAILDGVQDPTPEKIAALHTETMLLNRLVNDLRELTLAEAGQLKLDVKPMALKPLATKVVEMLQPMLQEKKITLSVKIAGSVPEVIADSDRLTQVFYNLITNALRHTPDEGTIEIGAKATGGKMVEVAVKDNGEGIPAADLPYIFEHFYRVDQARTRTTGGTGMGLAITKLLVEAHGGHVNVVSTPGAGSTFTFTLPVA